MITTIIPHHPHCCYVNIPGTTYLHILMHCTLYLIAHLTPYFISLFVSYFILTIFVYIYTRAVRLIEIEIKSRFEIARFRNRFIARFFSAPRPNLMQNAIRTNQNAAEQNRPGIQTDSMLKKQGRWVQNRIRTWWPKKCMLHAEHTAGSSDHISFRTESVFLKIPLRSLIRSAQNAPLVIC